MQIIKKNEKRGLKLAEQRKHFLFKLVVKMTCRNVTRNNSSWVWTQSRNYRDKTLFLISPLFSMVMTNSQPLNFALDFPGLSSHFAKQKITTRKHR